MHVSINTWIGWKGLTEIALAPISVSYYVYSKGARREIKFTRLIRRLELVWLGYFMVDLVDRAIVAPSIPSGCWYFTEAGTGVAITHSPFIRTLTPYPLLHFAGRAGGYDSLGETPPNSTL